MSWRNHMFSHINNVLKRFGGERPTVASVAGKSFCGQMLVSRTLHDGSPCQSVQYHHQHHTDLSSGCHPQI